MNVENTFNNPPQESPQSGEAAEEALAPKSILFDETKNTLLLKLDKNVIDLSDIDEKAAKDGLDRRSKFHITVLGFQNGGKVKKTLKVLPEAKREEVLIQIKSLIENTDWSFTLEPQIYHMSKEYVSADPKNKGVELRERRESYIQMINLPGMEVFYDKLNVILCTHLEAPPAHITLYTGGDDKEKSKMGIGINNQEEFLKMNPESIS